MTDESEIKSATATEEALTYADMMGTTNPAPVENFEEGKVELSIPQKVVPDPDVVEEPEVVAEPEIEAVPIYGEGFVDEEGIEHMAPPTYDKSALPEEKPLFVKPADMGEPGKTEDTSDAEVQVDLTDVEAGGGDDEPVPDFVRSWKNEGETDFSLDDEVNAALDGEDEALDTPQGEAVEDDGFVWEDVPDEQGDELLTEDDVTEAPGVSLQPEDIIVDEGQPAAQQAFIPRFELSPEEQQEAEFEDVEKQDNIVATEVLPDGEQVVEDNFSDETAEAVSPLSEEAEIFPEAAEPVEETEALPVSETPAAEAETDAGYQNNDDLYAREYSGYLSDEYFVVDSHSLQGEFSGNDKCHAIQINASQSSYGWGVHFDNGWFMGIRDVREYQLRNGRLPSPNGEITYGVKKMSFRNISRIVLYEVPRYFTYRR